MFGDVAVKTLRHTDGYINNYIHGRLCFGHI